MTGSSVSSRVGRYVRQHHLGLVAIFIAMSGTAYAVDGPLAGQNTVGSADIIDNEVASVDIADNRVQGGDIRDNSLTGNDIDESTLAEIPAATVGGYGRWSGGWDCDPESVEYDSCGPSVKLTLSTPARVLVDAQVTATTEVDSTAGFGKCRIFTTDGELVNTTQQFNVSHMENPDFFRVVIGRDNSGLTGMTHVLLPGEHQFWLGCNQIQESGAIRYQDAGIRAVAISPK